MASTLNGLDLRLERALERLRHWTQLLDEAIQGDKPDEAVAVQRRVDEYTLLVSDLRAKGARPIGG